MSDLVLVFGALSTNDEPTLAPYAREGSAGPLHTATHDGYHSQDKSYTTKPSFETPRNQDEQ